MHCKQRYGDRSGWGKYKGRKVLTVASWFLVVANIFVAISQNFIHGTRVSGSIITSMDTRHLAAAEESSSSLLVRHHSSPPPKLHILTAANKLQKNEVENVDTLKRSAALYGRVPLELVLLEDGHNWFVKVDVMRKVDTMVTNPADDFVLFADAFDTLVTISAEDIIRRFLKLEQNHNLSNAIVFNGAGKSCFPFELWGWKTDEVFKLSNGINVTGTEICDTFRTRFGGDNPCLNSGLYMGRARDVAELMQFVWENRHLPNFGDQSLIMQATKVFPNMLVDSNSTFLKFAHDLTVSEPDFCQSFDVDAGVLHFTKSEEFKMEWLPKCSEFYLGPSNTSNTRKKKREPKKETERAGYVKVNRKRRNN